MTAPAPSRSVPSVAAIVALRCACGALHAVSLHHDLSDPDRREALFRSASLAGWYQLAARWACGDCYGSEVRDAELLRRTGQWAKWREINEAAERRVLWVAMEVRR